MLPFAFVKQLWCNVTTWPSNTAYIDQLTQGYRWTHTLLRFKDKHLLEHCNKVFCSVAIIWMASSSLLLWWYQHYYHTAIILEKTLSKMDNNGKKGAFQQPPYLFAFSVLPYLFAFSVLFAKYPYEGFIASHKMQINYAKELTHTLTIKRGFRSDPNDSILKINSSKYWTLVGVRTKRRKSPLLRNV